MIPPNLIKKIRTHPVIKAACRASQEAGTPIYLVGGAVRDLLTGILPEKDFDFVVESNLLRIARRFATFVSGSLIQWSSEPLYYRVIIHLKRKRVEVDFSAFQGDTLDQDLHNRDFTVNAMALSVDQLFQKECPPPHDPLGGEEDLQNGILRTASEHSLDNDPLRMLRAVRIAKARSLSISAETKSEIQSRTKSLFSAAPERIRSEFFKTLSFPETGNSLKLLEELGLLSMLLPEARAFRSRPSEGPDERSRWELSLERVRWCEWMLHNGKSLCPLFHEDLTSHFFEEIEADVDRQSLVKLGGFLNDWTRSPQSETISNGAGALAKRFKLSKRANSILRVLSENSVDVLNAFLSKELNPRVYFRFFRGVGSEGLDLLVLSWAHFIACDSKRFDSPHDRKLRNLLDEFVTYYFDEYITAMPRPLITGKDIMEQFGLKEGKDVGRLLKKVAVAEGEGRLRSTKEALLYVEGLIGQGRSV